MEKKSITFVSPYAYPLLTTYKKKGAGGAERQFFLFGLNLIKIGWKVSFITERPEVSHLESEHIFPVSFANFSYLGGNKLNTFFDWISLFMAMKKTNSHYYAIKTPGHLLFPMKLFCKILKSKLIFWAQTEYDAYPQKRTLSVLPSMLQDMGTKFSDIIIGQNTEQIQGFKNNYNRKAFHIPNLCGTISDNVENENIPLTKVDILWVGNSQPNKQYEVVIELSRKMPDTVFVIAMNNSSSLRYKNAEKTIMNIKNIIFLGSVSPTMMEKWYSKAKLVLNTSIREGFPNTFLQAWQNGTPVVSLKVDPDHLIQNFQLGYVGGDSHLCSKKISFKDSADIVAPMLLNLLNNKELRQKMGANAKHYVELHHSASEVVPKLIELLESNKNKSRKATIGGSIRFFNLFKNWLHQAFTYMDIGEQIFRVIIETIEFALVMGFIIFTFNTSILSATIVGFLIVHTFNWVTNCLFWAVAIFAIPDLRNPGEKKTIEYLSKMTERLKKYHAISGLAIYGSVSRGKWHNRSDIDIRILRQNGIKNLISSSFLTMRERFISFVNKQPMDLYLADDVDFLKKMRSDEKPVFLIKRDKRLDKIYPDNPEQILKKLSA